jgi:integrase
MPYKEGKKWRGSVMVKGQRKTKLFTSKNKALDWERKKRKELKIQTATGSLADFSNRYLDYAQRKFSHDTYTEKKKILKDLKETFGNILIYEITPEILERFIYSRGSNNNCNRARKNLMAFFNYCKKLGLLYNPVELVERLPHQKTKQPVPTEEEVIRLLLAADRHDRNLIIAFCTTGGRRSEILRWTWTEDINLEKRIVRLGNRKNRQGEMRYRWVAMNQMLFDALQDQWRTRLPHSDYVFQNRAVWKDKRGNIVRKHPNYGDRYTARRRFMSGLCKRAGVKQFGFHGLRRFFASLLADKYKRSMPLIRDLLGQSSVAVTDSYVFNISEDAREAVETIKFENLHERLHKKAPKRG